MPSPQLPEQLRAPLESIKDQSVMKVRVIAAALFIGHPLYWWAWTQLHPQPYESVPWRAVGSFLGLATLWASLRFGGTHPQTAWIWGIASAFGTVFLASWFYVANGGNTVWLASLVALLMLYFSLTDWRLALVVTLLSLVAAGMAVPTLGIGVWSAPVDSLVDRPFSPAHLLILGFAVGVSVLTRYTDLSMRAVQMRSQLRALGITAHEIRTPIAGMSLLSQALRDRLAQAQTRPSPAQLQEMLDLANDLVAHCEDANARVSTHLANANPYKQFARRAVVSAAAVAKEAVASFQRGSGSREPLVNLEIERDFHVTADPVVLQQSIVNLLNNALKAVVLQHKVAAPGQIWVRVSFDAGGWIAVSDRGTGIRREDLRQIFQPFFTGDPTHGHGLGLTFVNSVIAAYDGTIDVTSAEGEGTTFTINFREATAV